MWRANYNIKQEIEIPKDFVHAEMRLVLWGLKDKKTDTFFAAFSTRREAREARTQNPDSKLVKIQFLSGFLNENVH